MATRSRPRFDIAAATAAVVLMVAASTACEKAPVERTVPPPMTASLSFAGLPDGPAPSTYANGPVTISPRDVPQDPGAKFHIIDGKLSVNPTTSESPASYFTTPNLGTPVIGIGAKWTFTRRGGSNGGAMGLVVSDTIFRPPFPIHLSVSTDKWGFGIWPPLDGEKIPDLIILDGGVFDPPLKDDGVTVHESEVTLDGDVATIRLPDGNRRTVKDKRIAEWGGNYATFEAFAKNGVTDAVVSFTEIWTRRKPTG
jgi:hypothetical protein